jgi:hypothetical protein
VQNKENGRFQLSFHYEFGEESDLRYSYAAEYLDYLGTDSLTAEQFKQQFYKLACSYNVSVGARSISVSLNGLSENMPEALRLLEHLMQHAKADNDAYTQYIAIREKQRMDAKADQRTNFQYLVQYAAYLKEHGTGKAFFCTSSYEAIKDSRGYVLQCHVPDFGQHMQPQHTLIHAITRSANIQPGNILQVVIGKDR